MLTTVLTLLTPTSSLPSPSSSMPPITTRLPRATPLPPQILSETPGTWAHDTMSRRVREEILERVVIGDNAGTPAFEAARPAIEALCAEISTDPPPLTHVPDDGGPDISTWREIMDPYVSAGATWLSALTGRKCLPSAPTRCSTRAPCATGQ